MNNYYHKKAMRIVKSQVSLSRCQSEFMSVV